MADKCNHPSDSLIDVTEVGQARYHYFCSKCGEVVIGYPRALINPVMSYIEELETLRKVKQWEQLGQ